MDVNSLCRVINEFNDELRSIRSRLTISNDRIAPRNRPPASAPDKPEQPQSKIFAHDMSNLLESMNGVIADLRTEMERIEEFTATGNPELASVGQAGQIAPARASY